jgi:4'-phosphopantetheinyl transferase
MSTTRTAFVPRSGRAVELGKRSVHIWSAGLDSPPEAVEDFADLLSGDEHARADRFVFAHHRNWYIVGRGFLRLILASYLGCPPEALRFRYGRRGKPALAQTAHPALHFNVSHSAGRVVYAVSGAGEIGVDVERIQQLDDMDGIARGCFSPREYAAYSTLSGRARLEAFFTGWTRKEAYVKALGDGLSIALDAFDVTLLPGEPARLERIDGEPLASTRWNLSDLSVAPGFKAAMVLDGPAVDITYMIIDEAASMTAQRALVP